MIFQRNARDAKNLSVRSLKYDREAPANECSVHPGKIKHRLHTHGFQSLAVPGADSPDFLDRRNRHGFVLTFRRQLQPIDNAVKNRIGLGKVVAQFGKRLGGSNPCARRNADPLVDALPYGLRQRGQTCRIPVFHPG